MTGPTNAYELLTKVIEERDELLRRLRIRESKPEDVKKQTIKELIEFLRSEEAKHFENHYWESNGKEFPDHDEWADWIENKFKGVA